MRFGATFGSVSRRNGGQRQMAPGLMLQRLLGVLRDVRVAPPAHRSSVQRTAVQCLTDRYRRHLLDDKGLAESTGSTTHGTSKSS